MIINKKYEKIRRIDGGEERLKNGKVITNPFFVFVKIFNNLSIIISKSDREPLMTNPKAEKNHFTVCSTADEESG